MLSAKTRWNIYRIIPFGVIWLVFSIVYVVLEKGLLGDLTYYPSTGNPYNFSGTVLLTPVAALIAGLMIGVVEIIYVNRLLAQKSFTQKIVYKSAIYLALIIAFLVLTSALASSIELRLPYFSKIVWTHVWAFFTSYAFLSAGFYMAAIIVVSQFFSEVSENMGHEVLVNFFTGKYHSPTEEERIYMFLDMKSSTTIAEHLGHVKYFEMLKEYYSDLSEPIIRFSGEIYQYVGDEIVVSWKIKNGLQSANCLQCFFAIKEVIKNEHEKYNKRFGILPVFKAGFHLGKVTTGEIGVIKKDIIFTGDVLNTAARIQGLCNFYGVDLLTSSDLIKKLDLPSQYKLKPLGESELRGRNERIELFTIDLS